MSQNRVSWVWEDACSNQQVGLNKFDHLLVHVPKERLENILKLFHGQVKYLRVHGRSRRKKNLTVYDFTGKKGIIKNPTRKGMGVIAHVKPSRNLIVLPVIVIVKSKLLSCGQ